MKTISLVSVTVSALAAAPCTIAAPQIVLGAQVQIQTTFDLELRGDSAVDIDGDGVTDIVVAMVTRSAPPDGSTAEMGFAKGLGSRSFGAVQPIAPGRSVDETFATADLDGDGDIDLVGAQVSPTRRLLLLENDGNGTFTAHDGPLQEQATDFVLGDIDGDGDLDLFFSGRELIAGVPVPGIRVAVLDGLTWTGTIIDSGLQGPGFDVGDLDGDGRADVANYTRNSRAYVLSNGPGFGAPVPLPAPLSATDTAPALQIEDVTADSIADIILYDLDEVRVGSVSGPLGPTELLAGPSSDLRGALLADLDGDGAVDLLFPSGQWVGRAPGTGLLPFVSTGITLLGMQQANLRTTRSLIDADGDGYLDRPRSTLLFSIGDLVRPNELIRYGDGTDFPVTSFAGFDFLRPGGNTSSASVTALDADRDGDMDLVATAFDSSDWIPFENMGGLRYSQRTAIAGLTGDERANLLSGDGDGDGWDELAVFVDDGSPRIERFDFDSQWDVRVLDSVPVAGVFFLIGFEDLNGDGFDDLMAKTQSSAIIFPGGIAGLGAPINFPGTLFLGTTLADADGDGDLDVFNACSEYENLGSFQFLERSPCTGGGVDVRVLADVTGDGIQDQLIVLKLSVRFAPGLTPFEFGPSMGLTSFDNTNLRVNLPTDLDRNGVSEFTTNSLVAGGVPGVLSTAPNGTLTQEIGIPGFSPGYRAFDLGVSDLDGDGDQDLFGVVARTVFVSENLSDLGVGLDTCTPTADNSAGLRSNLDVFGPASASSDTVTVSASQLPPNVFGIVFGGQNIAPPMPIPGAGGQICIAPPFGRYQRTDEIRFSGPDGAFTLNVGTDDLRAGSVAFSAIAGLTWSFQAWHRDAGPAGPSSQLTNAVSFVFRP